MATNHPPGFYKTNPRALTFGELIRWYGLIRAPLRFLSTRLIPLQGGYWMPGLLPEIECSPQDLSAGFWDFTAPARAAFQSLGFCEAANAKVKPDRNLDPNYRDQGSLLYIHSNRSHIGSITYIKVHVPAPINTEREVLAMAFTSAYEKKQLIYRNRRKTFDSAPESITVSLETNDPARLHQSFLGHLNRIHETPLSFPDNEAFRCWYDEQKLRTFNRHVDCGLFVKMTDVEVAAARQKLPPTLPT